MTIEEELQKMFDTREEKKCPFCKKPINEEEFRDKISRNEFKVSGLCQKCQDEFFK